MNYRINYVGRENDDDSLKHFKYISRKKVGDKWQYTYPKDLKSVGRKIKKKVKDVAGYGEEDSAKRALKEYRKSQNKVRSSKAKLDMRTKENAAYGITFVNGKGHTGPENMTQTEKTMRGINKESAGYRWYKSINRQKGAKKKLDAAEAKYKKTPLYKVRKMQSSIKKGKEKVSNYFKKRKKS